jgi:octaprenyl-diphosphate synthase
MQSFATALEERNFRVLELLISLTQQMVEGELLQMQKLGRLINEEEYFDLIYRKTACLFSVSMQLGAAITGASDETESQLGEYGRNLGLAFQIVDDMLDLTAAEDILGKPVASDLREGKATLAVIHALERGTGADREAIRTVLAERSFTSVSRPRILEILERHGSIAYAMDTACAYAEAARLSIADLPHSEAKRALLWVPGFVTSRDR